MRAGDITGFVSTCGPLTLSPSEIKVRGKPVAVESEIMSEDLNHPAYALPLTELVDLWVTRYGNDWVDLDVVEGDPFYKHVHARLRQLGQLEQHYLTDRTKYVCRRPE